MSKICYQLSKTQIIDMSNKKKEPSNLFPEAFDMMQAISVLAQSSYFFGGSPRNTEPESPYENLGNGCWLRPIELKDEKGNDIPNDRKYSHLYLDGQKISDKVFRKGGMGGEFKDGYCELIYYVEEKGMNEYGFSFGTHVIINAMGHICLEGTGISSYPAHRGGNIGWLDDTYYNLVTSKPIMPKSSSEINGKDFIIVEHRYDWYGKKNGTQMPLGIYKINKRTCEIEKIDEVRK